MVNLIRDEFDNKIYLEVIHHFGSDPLPDNFPSGGENGKVQLMICNIPAGGLVQLGQPNAYLNYIKMTQAGDPSAYALIAHEFQHLVSGFVQVNNWDRIIEEGLATLAEYILYDEDEGVRMEGEEKNIINNSLGHISLYYHPANEASLNYGARALIFKHIYGRYGRDMIQGIVHDPNGGPQILQNQLDIFDPGVSLDEFFRRFALAIMFDIPDHFDGIYDLKTHDLSQVFDEPIEDRSPALHKPELTKESDRYVLPTWGVHTRLLRDHDPQTSLAELEWGIEIYRFERESLRAGGFGSGDESLVFEADLRNVPSATLNFESYQEFLQEEQEFSMGFIQVSEDNGLTWNSLSNADTTRDVGFNHDEIQNNLPGLQDRTQEWQDQSFDLTEFTGRKILLKFRYIAISTRRPHTWFIDNITIPEIGFENTADGDSLADFLTDEDINERLYGSVTDIAFKEAFILEPMWSLTDLSSSTTNIPVNEDDPLVITGALRAANNLDTNAIIAVDLSSVPNATLKFDNFRRVGLNNARNGGIGFVQVSTDNGANWQSLANDNTAYEVGLTQEKIRQHLPGLRGNDTEWQQEEFELSPYAGNKILINFRFMTARNVGGAKGWFIDNIVIPEIGYRNDCDSADDFRQLGSFNGLTDRYAVTFVHQVDDQYDILILDDPVNKTEQEADAIRQYLASGKTFMVISYKRDIKQSIETRETISYDYDIERTYEFTGESGDFRVKTGNQFITFLPLKPTVGNRFVYLELFVNGSYRGSFESKSNTPYLLSDVKEGDRISFSYKYSILGSQKFSEIFTMIQKPLGLVGANDTFEIDIDGNTVTFKPLKEGVGDAFSYIHYSVDGSPLSSYSVKADAPYSFEYLNKGQTVEFNYSYSLADGSQHFSQKFILKIE